MLTVPAVTIPSAIVEMDWTGGTLQRLRAGRQNGVVQKQKEHFAKVRTQLQNSANSLAQPFRPSYLEDDDHNLGGRLPRFGFGAARHVGHTRRLHGRRDRKESHTASNIRCRQGPDTHQVAEPLLSRTKSRYESASPTGSNDLKRKRKTAATDPEDELLEVNKRRLLQKPDWVGLAPSRPVNMRFSSSKEKASIGKRRKTRGRLAAHHTRSEPLNQETPYHTNGNHPWPYMSRALPVKRDQDIRIRIGTDALTSRYSDHAQRQTSATSGNPSSDHMSDSMLFHNEHLNAASGESMQPARLDSLDFSMSVGVSTEFHAVSPHAQSGNERALEQSRTHRKQSVTSYTEARSATGRDSNQQTSGEDPIVHITRHVGGVKHPVRFVFDRRSETLHTGGATQSPGAANAGLVVYEHEKADQGKNDNDMSDDDGAQRPSSADDGPWKFSHAGSSSLSTRKGSGLSRLPQLPLNTVDGESGFTEVSQHTTLRGQTRINTSSFMSVSLPSIQSDRESEQGRLEDQFQGAKRFKNSEESWQSIIPGRSNMVFHTMHDGSSVEEKNSKSSVNCSPRLLPLSLAVASRTSDGVQEAANRKPHPTFSRGISSPEATEMHAQEVDKTADGPLSAVHSIYSEEESLIHASIINNVSHDMNATLSRNGSGRSCGSDFGPALAKRSERSRQLHGSSIYNTLDSDSEGIDLVDSERLW